MSYQEHIRNCTFIILITVSGLWAEEGSKADNRLETRDWKLEERGENAGHQVRAGDYCEFLNEIASTDADCFFEEKMKGLVRTGEPGSYHYDVAQGENATISFVSQLEDIYYRDWLENAVSTSTDNFNCCEVAESRVAAYDKQLQSNRNGFSIHAETMADLIEKNAGKEDPWKNQLMEVAAVVGMIVGGVEVPAVARENAPLVSALDSIRLQEGILEETRQTAETAGGPAINEALLVHAMIGRTPVDVENHYKKWMIFGLNVNKLGIVGPPHNKML